MAEELSIFDEFKSRSYDASLIATFNAFLPFYEDVLLRRLVAKGCLHNVVMMDARQCGAALQDEGARPRRAGRDYSLLPVKAGSSFHPKIILLVARGHGVLLVGSHNLTMSGFGLNGELTTRFEYASDKNRAKDWDTLATFQGAFRFLKDWADSQPEEMQEMLEKFEQLAPWLRDLLPADAESYFIGSRRNGPPLWDLVHAKLPVRARQITVVGPFFDHDLEFLRKLEEEYAPKNMVIGIDPSRTGITRRARRLLPRAKFVNVKRLDLGNKYIHAKAILFESSGGEEVLVAGSANPSRAAWLASDKRNAEAVVIQSGRRGLAPASTLGLTNLATEAELSAEDWERISEASPDDDFGDADRRLPLIAFTTDGGFEIAGFSAGKESVDEIKVLTGAGASLGVCTNLECDGDRIRVEIMDVEKMANAVILELCSGPAVIAYAIVHHLEELQNNGGTDAQRAFQRSLATLNTDSPMLEEVIRIVNKVIFEDFDETTIKSSKGKSEQGGEPSDDSDDISEFEVSIAETKKAKKRKRFYAGGDLGLIINALIYNLGAGLRAGAESSDPISRSEEELINSEDEELVQKRNNDGRAMAEVCRRKVKTLLGRMIRQFELAFEEGANYLRPILQLAAVLGVINFLRNRAETAAWVPRRECLLPNEALRNLFNECSWYLYSRQSGFLEEAIVKLGGADCREISVVRGLLVWLAWESGLDVETVSSGNDDDEMYSRLLGLEQLLHLAPDALGDNEAAEIARHAITRPDLLDKYKGWLARHQRWAEEIVELSRNPAKIVALRREPERGDVVRRTRGTDCPLTVVLERNGDKLNLGEKIDAWYKVEVVEVIDIPMITSRGSSHEKWSPDDWRRMLGY
ncbi:MAG: hypothetical protein MOB07_04910 [Acidobacteria bacterium]|nr:hypothetical protein [Acidobacteriota bacterium]